MAFRERNASRRTRPPTPAGPWYRDVTRANRRALIAAFLGWGFDGYETYALVVVLAPMMHDLLGPAQQANLPFWGGLAVGITLLGWAIGGVAGGVIADRVGRKRVMLISIVAYALSAGLTALAGNLETLLVLRFLTGLSLGSEWGTGASLIAETWPTRARAKAAGIMQAGFGFGAVLASAVWLGLSQIGSGEWRFVFVIGVVPALFTLYIRRHVAESPAWQNAKHESKRLSDGPVRRRFTLAELFADRRSRRRALLTLVLSVCSIGAYYTVSTSLPLFVKELATAQGRTDADSLTSLAGLTYNIGSILGYIAGGFIADIIGRKRYITGYLIGSVATTALLYLTTTSLPAVIALALINGFFTLGMFAAFAIYLPELFPATIRATAIGFVFNSTRIIAALGPVVFGGLVLAFGGVTYAAVILSFLYILGIFVLPTLPETKGLPLHDVDASRAN